MTTPFDPHQFIFAPEQQKITFGEMREMDVLGLLVYSDCHCSAYFRLVML
jgi:hypothetical protein